jgi:hypothetical protein
MGPVQSCFCGKLSTARKCTETDYETGWSSGQRCNDILACSEHACSHPCHEGICGPCNVEVEAQCYCGNVKQSIKCYEKDEEKQSYSWTGSFDCGSTCGTTGAPQSTVYHRRAGRPPRSQTTVRSARLTPRQEAIFARWITDLQLQYQPVNYTQLTKIAEKLARENDPSRPLGKNWVSRFIKRSPMLSHGRSQPLAKDRILSMIPSQITICRKIIDFCGPCVPGAQLAHTNY